LKGRYPKVPAILTILLLSSFAGAQTLTGTVTNGKTGKPARYIASLSPVTHPMALVPQSALNRLQ
jgi:hypothetical protein